MTLGENKICIYNQILLYFNRWQNIKTTMNIKEIITCFFLNYYYSIT